jgi:hypothetical protein
MYFTLIAVGLLSAAVIMLAVWVIMLERRLQKFLGGKEARQFEDIVLENQEQLRHFSDVEEEFRKAFLAHDARIRRKVDGVTLKRFNPFEGMGTGGNHSFAAALLDEEGNGAVLSALYSRERMSVYAKPVANHASDVQLTEEEAEVIK